jgi:hypothetical protein
MMAKRNIPYRLKSDRATIRKASTAHTCGRRTCGKTIERGEYYVVYDHTGGRRDFHLDPCAILMRIAEPTGEALSAD